MRFQQQKVHYHIQFLTALARMEMSLVPLCLLVALLSGMGICSQGNFGDLFNLKRNTFREVYANQTESADTLIQCLFLCLGNPLCQCFNYRANGTCEMMFYNPKSGVYQSQLSHTDWTLGCRKSGMYSQGLIYWHL